MSGNNLFADQSPPPITFPDLAMLNEKNLSFFETFK